MNQASVMKRVLTFLGRVAGGAALAVAVIVVGILSGWSPLNLLFGPQYEAPRDTQPTVLDERVLEASRTVWWTTDYEQLNATLDQQGGSLSASYRTGPDGQSVVNVHLSRGPYRALTLVVDAPPESVRMIDEHTGRLAIQEDRNVFTFHDVDLDSMPDHVRIVPAGQPISGESLTENSFMRVRDDPDHAALLVQWTIGIGYCTNYFLHGKESAFP